MRYKELGILHGADYNPDQWLANPEVLEQDIEYMKLANINVVSLGIFAWGRLEPSEGVYDFDWLEQIVHRLYTNGIYTILATPSATRPAWMAKKYPEVMRVNANRERVLFSGRANFCLTSPIYRQKVSEINKALALRFKDNPAVIMWHISNEYANDCHCELCQERFRAWLKAKYNDIQSLNSAWWTDFWGHTFYDFSEISSPSPIGEDGVHGLTLDWKRFTTDQTVDFYLNEIAPLKEITPEIPATTNFMGVFEGLDYHKLAKVVEVISWDSYPKWHSKGADDMAVSSVAAFNHSLTRCHSKDKTFMLMESTPSLVNWNDVNKVKRPGMHTLSSMHAIANGSDTVQYFQWRKSRGGCEKFHGAVVDHNPVTTTRVFKEITKLGKQLTQLGEVVSSKLTAPVALLYDWDNRWAFEDCKGFSVNHKDYLETCYTHFNVMYNKSIAVDVISRNSDLTPYKIVIAPILYMVDESFAKQLEVYVKKGGIFISTYGTGMVDDNDLCHLGGVPGPLKDILGYVAEEIDSLYEDDKNTIIYKEHEYTVKDYCEVIIPTTSTPIALYQEDYIESQPAVVRNNYHSGVTYHIGGRIEERFYEVLYSELLEECGIKPPLVTLLPEQCSVTCRQNDEYNFYFLMNFSTDVIEVSLIPSEYYDMINHETVTDQVLLHERECIVLKEKRN